MGFVCSVDEIFLRRGADCLARKRRHLFADGKLVFCRLSSHLSDIPKRERMIAVTGAFASLTDLKYLKRCFNDDYGT